MVLVREVPEDGKEVQKKRNKDIKDCFFPLKIFLQGRHLGGTVS